MSTLRQAAYGFALLLAITLLIWGSYQQGQAAQARAKADAERITTLEQRSARQAQTIISMGADIAAQRLAQQSLQNTRADLQQANAVHQVQKKETVRNDPPAQNWAAQPLPALTRRLHERPAITGATGYRAFLSGRDAVHPAAGGTDR
ncbi:phage lysis regulatory protein, LysB family [Pseudomonas argentinensis]|uniref:Phage lysis regulatory protein, LysB family n=1 Tax=Phytopseudomonas argentinensis TaxID=289370 RepID=A0A1I3I6F2_9GAMM|nr:phage lysis regulatory protein, LysB family [Pseudomonas argentinensis]